MTPWRNVGAASLLLVAIGLSTASPARADVTKDQCVEANTSAQNLRLDGKLSAAREQLTICNSASCPRIVRDDCAERLTEVQRAQPTIVFDVRDAAGNDVSGVHVAVDGHDVEAALDGRALPIDPGAHPVTFTADGLKPKTETFVLKEGEKGRIERVVLEPERAAPPPVPQPPSPPAEPSSSWGGQRIAGAATAGAGVVGLVLGGIFGATTFSATSRQKADCASPTSCSDHAAALSDHHTATTDGLVSTVSFVAGAALVAGGAALFFTAKSGSDTRDTRSTAGIALAPSVGPGSTGVVCVGRF